MDLLSEPLRQKVYRSLWAGWFQILQERGLFRKEYEHDTLRGNLGLNVLENRYSKKVVR